ncbi:MAG: AbrB/MazE/SpoVT family DNA-binding domain-containing protein [Pseudomonadota bacterium]
MATATLTSKGQLTLPKSVRSSLGLSTGDRVTFVRLEDGSFALVAATRSVRSLKGIVPVPATPVSLDDMDRAIAQGVSGRAVPNK